MSQAGRPPLLSVRELCKFFPVQTGGLFRKQTKLVKAVNEVSFDLHAGRTLGLVGESGCGKTTTARTILRALDPTAGDVFFRPDEDQRINLAKLPHGALKPLRTQMQMIFQDPFASLNPRMTIEQIVGEPLTIHQVVARDERTERIVQILRKVGLNADHLKRYPHEFSGGQRQRIGIARALILRPKLVVCDEAVSALDVSVQAQVINLLKDLQEEFDLTYIFVAHDLSVVRHIADEVAVMYAGRIVEHSPCDALFGDPQHPYTKALLSAVPHPDPDVPMNFDLGGEVADPAKLPPGCSFNPRCNACFEPCTSEVPPLTDQPGGQRVACHLYSEPAAATAEAQP